jgi:Ca2+-binding RTX toxin-like protein
MLNPISAPIQVNLNTANIEFPDLMFNAPGGQKGVIYKSILDPENGGEVLVGTLRYLDASGVPTGGEFTINYPALPANGEYFDDPTVIGLSNGNFALTYTVGVPSGGNTPPTVNSYMQIYSASGVPVGGTTQIGTTGAIIQDVTEKSTGFVVLTSPYNAPSGGLVYEYSSTGGLLGASTISVPSNPAQQIASLANGGYVYGYSGIGGAARIDFDGANPPITLPSPPTNPSLGILNFLEGMAVGPSGEVIAVVYEQLSTLDAQGQPTSSSFQLKVWKAVDGNAVPTLLATIAGPQNVPPTSEAYIELFGLAVLVDGSVVVGYDFTSGSLPDVKLVRINAAGGIQTTVDLGIGGFDGAGHLTVLPDQSVLVTFGAAPSGGELSQFEVYSQRFLTGAVPVPPVPTPGDDTLTGTTGDDLIDALAGNDMVDALGGNDTINGNLGNDSLTGGTGNDSFVNSSGFDTITDFVAGGTDDSLNIAALAALSDFAKAQGLAAQVGADTILTLGFNNVVTLKNVTLGALTAADFTLAAAAPNNTMNGTVGPDTITGTGGVDSIIGGTGNDTLGGFNGNDTLSGGDNDDYLYGGAGDNLLEGGSGIDVMIAEAGNDTLIGGDGTDYFYAGTGNNVLSGGAGTDVFISEGANDIMNGGADHNFFYRYGTGGAYILGGDGIDEFAGGNAASNDTFEGGGGLDYGFGGDGDDVLNGGAGNDVLIGQNGNDTIDGGAGVNLIWCNDVGNDQVRINTADAGTQVIDFFEAGGANDSVRILGSNLTSFADFQNLVTNYNTVINGNLVVNTATTGILYLNLGANQTAIWFQGIAVQSLTAADFTFG